MSVTIDTSSIPLTWDSGASSTWTSLNIYDWTDVPQFTYDMEVTLTLELLESLVWAQGININESLLIVDDYVRQLQGMISDLTISTETIDSISDFEDLIVNGRPPGFSNFKSFIQGDYTYTEALFKAILGSTELTGRTELGEFQIEVDLPDVIERGQTTITDANAGISVVYGKSFYIIPELTISFKGGSTISIPELSNQTLIGFDVKLKNPATDTYVTGTVSWAAHGY